MSLTHQRFSLASSEIEITVQVFVQLVMVILKAARFQLADLGKLCGRKSQRAGNVPVEIVEIRYRC